MTTKIGSPEAIAALRYIALGSRMIHVFESMYKHILEDAKKTAEDYSKPLWKLVSLAEKVGAHKEYQTEGTDAILERCNAHAAGVLLGFEQRFLKRQESALKRLSWTSRGVKLDNAMFESFEALENEYRLLETQLHKITWKAIGMIGPTPRSGEVYIKENIGNRGRIFNNDSAILCLKKLEIWDPRSSLQESRISNGDVIAGSCEWILELKQWIEWEASDHGFLWISAEPGMGKTTLSTYIISRLEDRSDLKEAEPADIVLFHFCESQGNEQDTTRKIAMALLFQILDQDRRLLDDFLPEYRARGDDLLHNSSPDNLWDILINVLHHISPDRRISFIIDGPDECNDGAFGALIDKIKHLVSSRPRFRAIVLSREHPKPLDLSPLLFTSIHMDLNMIGKSFESFLSGRLSELPKEKGFSVEEIELMTKAFKERSAGVYLWAEIVINHLRTLDTRPIGDYINDIPSGLENLYTWLLEQVSDPQEQNIVRNILRWCVFSARSMAPGELIAALGLSKSGNNDPSTVIKRALGNSSALFSISARGVRLVHHTFRDLLTQSQGCWFSLSDTQQEQSVLASVCITSLESAVLGGYPHSYDVWSPTCPEIFGHSLGHYAGSFWEYHFRRGGMKEADALLDRHQEFFSGESVTLDQWIRWRTGEGLGVYGGLSHVAATYGLEVLMRRILSRGFARSQKIPKYSSQSPPLDWLQRTPLHKAAKNGHTALVKMRTGHEKMDFAGNTPLHYAAMSGSALTIDSLLKAGANVHGSNREIAGKLPIEIALGYDDIPAVKALIDHGVGFGGKDLLGHTMLMRQARLGRHERMISYLISRSNNTILTAKNYAGESVLHLSCQSGLISTVHELLKKGCFNVNEKTQNGGTLLHYAAEAPRNGVKLTELLLEQPEISDEVNDLQTETPLDRALKHGQAETVRFWVERRDLPLPRPSAKSHFGALHMVALHGTYDLAPDKLRLLVDTYKLDPSVRTLKSIGDLGDTHESHNTGLLEITTRNYSCSETPLALAVTGGDAKTVHILVEQFGADIHGECRGCDGATPLHVAAQCCRADMVYYLIKYWKCNVNTLDNRGRTPLHLLAIRTPTAYEEDQRWEAVRMLLLAGSDVSLQDTHRRTPRHLFEFQSRKRTGRLSAAEEFDKILAEVRQI